MLELSVGHHLDFASRGCESESVYESNADRNGSTLPCRVRQIVVHLLAPLDPGISGAAVTVSTAKSEDPIDFRLSNELKVTFEDAAAVMGQSSAG